MEEKNIASSEFSEDNALTSEKKRNHTKFIWAAGFFLVIILASLFGSIFGFMAGGIAQKIFPDAFKTMPSSNSQIIQQRLVEEDSAVIDVVSKSTPAVVSIVVTKDVPTIRSFFYDPFNFYDPFGSSQNKNQGATEKKKVGGGTGFLISEDGMIVTNRHVVSDGSADYTVITSDDKEYAAKILAKDPIKDVAVMKIEGKDFKMLEFGDSDNLKIGETAIAIGNSLGEFSNTVSKGIISGLGRDVTAGGNSGEMAELKNIIQTDAAINPGNSGGPLLNIFGKVIGINVAMAENAQNIGFAIPANQVKKIVEQVQKTGKISTPYLGVRYIPLTKEIQKENDLPFDYGVLIMRGQKITDFAVVPGSPADKAGLMENDIILEIDGIKVDLKNSLTDIIAKYNSTDTIILKIWHKGDTKDVRVQLAERK
jgi:S1-C subfamily serine protease